MAGAGRFAVSTGLAAVFARGAGDGLAGADGAAACGGCAAVGAVSVVWTAGEVTASGCGCDCPRQTMNSSAPTAIKATKMPIWTIFISDLPPSRYYATNSGFFSFLFVDG
jgi:hypothetical protein